MKLTKLNLLIAAGLVLLLTTPAQSQFVKTLGIYGIGLSVIEGSDGEIFVTGYTGFGAGDYDLLLAKFDASGNHLWTRTLGGSGDDWGYSVIEASDGGLVVTGHTFSFGAGGRDFLLAKFDASGNRLWTRTLGGGNSDYGRSVIEASDGGLVVTGYTMSFGAGQCDLLLAKFDASGNYLWTRTLGGPYNDYGYSLVEASDGGIIVTGTSNSFYGATNSDFLLAKFDASGNYLWTRILQGYINDYGHSVIEASDGGIIAVGTFNTMDSPPMVSPDTLHGEILLTKFDASGALLWARTLGGANEEDGYSVIEASDGGGCRDRMDSECRRRPS